MKSATEISIYLLREFRGAEGREQVHPWETRTGDHLKPAAGSCVARLPVFDRNDHLVGMLSIKDVSTHCSHETSGGLLEAVAKHRH